MSSDFFHANSIHVINRCSHGNGTFDIRCSGFIFEGEIVVCCMLEGDFLDHFTTTTPWWQLIEDLFFTIEDANSCRAVDFVT